ncbi:MAG: paraquat-inducible membrane protein A [Sulfurimonas sp.]|nr:MAG: paraquat-inducible membrane protein A [Sulfurimonas sp.]
MLLESEKELDLYVICPACSLMHKHVNIKHGTNACCSACGGILYRYDKNLATNGLALSITGMIFFILSISFPLVQIEILGNQQFVSIPKVFLSLFEQGFYIVGFFCLFLIFIFPFMIFLLNILIFSLLKLKKGEIQTKNLLLLLSHIAPWSMSHIFFVSILIALIKLIGYAQIDLGFSFFALICFVLLDLYLTKVIHVSEIWSLRKKTFEDAL